MRGVELNLALSPLSIDDVNQASLKRNIQAIRGRECQLQGCL